MLKLGWKNHIYKLHKKLFLFIIPGFISFLIFNQLSVSVYVFGAHKQMQKNYSSVSKLSGISNAGKKMSAAVCD